MLFPIIFAALFVYFYLWQRRRLLYYGSKIKGVSGLPILGATYKILFIRDIMEEYDNLSDQYGETFKMWVGPRLFVTTHNPDDCEIVLNSPETMDKTDQYVHLAEAGANGLVTLNSERWRFHRKSLNPSFGPAVVNSFVPIFNKHVKIYTEKLSKHCGKGPFNICDNLKLCSMDMLCETTLGIKMNLQNSEDLEFFHAAHDVTTIISKRFLFPWIQPDLLFRISRYYNTFCKAVNVLNSTVNKIISKKKKEYFTKEEVKPTHKNVFISQILKLSLNDKAFTDDDIAGELKSIVMAGYDSIAICIMNAYTMLAMHPKIQEKLYREIMEFAPSNDEDVTLEQLSNMTYLDAVLNETMRLTPAAPFIIRAVKKDIQLGNVTTVPEGTEIVLNVWKLHRNQKNWKFDAKQFNPENFLPENDISRSKYSFLPFSAGPRNCIGKRYATIAMKIFLIHTIRKYRLSTKYKRLKDLEYQIQVFYSIANADVIAVELRK